MVNFVDYSVGMVTVNYLVEKDKLDVVKMDFNFNTNFVFNVITVRIKIIKLIRVVVINLTVIVNLSETKVLVQEITEH